MRVGKVAVALDAAEDGGMRLGLAKGKWRLPSDFDEKFDSADGEVEKHMSGDELH